MGVDAFAFDVESVQAPIRNWDDLAALIPADAAERIHRRALSGNTALLILRYERGGETGVLSVRISPPEEDRDEPFVAALTSASTDLSVRKLRGGPDTGTLSEKHVAVIGVGAIGSFVADILSRSGVGRLSLYDRERVRPGNVIRHLASQDDVGELKIDAVRSRLLTYGLQSADDINGYESGVSTTMSARLVLETHDLTVDATADSTGSSVLSYLATELSRNLVSVAVLREGGIARTDRFPLRPGESHADPIPYVDLGPQGREAGCGDPVSLTPPSSVLEAAVMAARQVVDVLTAKFALPPTMTHVLSAQDDPPFDQVGFLP